jgi:hypothetical protein
MLKRLSFGLVAALAATTLAAQTSARAAASTADRVTVTGCIERADQVTTSAANTADPDSLQYVLVRPAPGQSSTGVAPAPTGTAGTAGDSRVMYRLSGDQQKLNPHVGHKVEIVGTPSVMAPASAAAGSATASALPTGSAPGLTVESVRMIDATCAAK